MEKGIVVERGCEECLVDEKMERMFRVASSRFVRKCSGCVWMSRKSWFEFEYDEVVWW